MSSRERHGWFLFSIQTPRVLPQVSQPGSLDGHLGCVNAKVTVLTNVQRMHLTAAAAPHAKILAIAIVIWAFDDQDSPSVRVAAT